MAPDLGEGEEDGLRGVAKAAARAAVEMGLVGMGCAGARNPETLGVRVERSVEIAIRLIAGIALRGTLPFVKEFLASASGCTGSQGGLQRHTHGPSWGQRVVERSWLHRGRR